MEMATGETPGSISTVQLRSWSRRIGELLDISRTQFLIEALRDEIEDFAGDEEIQRTIDNAQYFGSQYRSSAGESRRLPCCRDVDPKVQLAVSRLRTRVRWRRAAI